mmetsp:Transcript_41780/g.84018  ORF Transcript_41780/g.84018 Transcript_41780/m.84018 type:complete len:259 (-) Transcript_41780:197-973(-)
MPDSVMAPVAIGTLASSSIMSVATARVALVLCRSDASGKRTVSTNPTHAGCATPIATPSMARVLLSAARASSTLVLAWHGRGEAGLCRTTQRVELRLAARAWLVASTAESVPVVGSHFILLTSPPASDRNLPATPCASAARRGPPYMLRVGPRVVSKPVSPEMVSEACPAGTAFHTEKVTQMVFSAPGRASVCPSDTVRKLSPTGGTKSGFSSLRDAVAINSGITADTSPAIDACPLTITSAGGSCGLVGFCRAIAKE